LSANFLEKSLIKNHALTKTAWSSDATVGDKPAQRFQRIGLGQAMPHLQFNGLIATFSHILI